MEGRYGYSFAISCVVVLMDSTGRRDKHARTGGKKGGVIDPLVEFFQEFFGVLFQVVDARFEGKKRRIIQTVVNFLEVHEGLPRKLNIKTDKRFEGLFKDIPIRFESFVAKTEGQLGRSFIRRMIRGFRCRIVTGGK